MRLPTRRIMTVNAASPPKLVRTIRNSPTWMTNRADVEHERVAQAVAEVREELASERLAYRETVRSSRRAVRSNHRSMSFNSMAANCATFR